MGSVTIRISGMSELRATVRSSFAFVEFADSQSSRCSDSGGKSALSLLLRSVPQIPCSKGRAGVWLVSQPRNLLR